MFAERIGWRRSSSAASEVTWTLPEAASFVTADDFDYSGCGVTP
jgi:hypothetical protein